MTFYRKVSLFCKDHVVMLVGVPLIVGVHWSWYKLQDIPYLVKPEDKKDIPPVIGYRKIKAYVEEKYHNFRGDGQVSANKPWE